MLVATVAATTVTAAELHAQAAAPPADITIIANVRAKELRFTFVPKVTVHFTGSVNGIPNVTVHKTDRHNLPEEVQPNVTYRDIGIRLTITSTLANIEQILDEVLGPESRVIPEQQSPESQQD